MKKEKSIWHEEPIKREQELTIKEKIELLENDIESYCGDWGTLESKIQDTFTLILDILKSAKN